MKKIKIVTQCLIQWKKIQKCKKTHFYLFEKLQSCSDQDLIEVWITKFKHRWCLKLD